MSWELNIPMHICLDKPKTSCLFMIRRIQLKLSFHSVASMVLRRECNWAPSSKQPHKQLILLAFQLTNASKALLPLGPLGYNGTQGPPGPPGPAGSSNLTLCSYVRGFSTGQSPDTYATQEVEITEPNVGLKVTLAKSGFVLALILMLSRTSQKLNQM